MQHIAIRLFYQCTQPIKSAGLVSKYAYFSDDEDEKPAKKELKPGAAKGFLKKEAGGDDDEDDSDSEDWGSSDSVRFQLDWSISRDFREIFEI